MKRLLFSYKLLSIVLALIVLLGAGSAAYIQHRYSASHSSNSAGKVDYSPAKKSDNTANEQRKNSFPTSSANAQTNSKGTTSSMQTGAPSTAFTITITNANVNTDLKNVHIGTLVNGTTAGNCTLIAQHAGQPNVIKYSSVHQDNNTISCGVFNIPFSDFPRSGEWRLTLSVENTGTVASDSWSEPITIPSS